MDAKNTFFGVDMDFGEQKKQDCVLKFKNMWKNAVSNKQRGILFSHSLAV